MKRLSCLLIVLASGLVIFTNWSQAGTGGTRACHNSCTHDNGCFMRGDSGCGNCGFSPSWNPSCGAAGCGNVPGEDDGPPPCSPTNGSCNTGDSSSKPACDNGQVSQYTGAGASCGGSNPTCYSCLQCKEGSLSITKESCLAEGKKYIAHTYSNALTNITCGECVACDSNDTCQAHHEGYQDNITSCEQGYKLEQQTYTNDCGKTTTCGKCVKEEVDNCETAYGQDGYHMTITSCGSGQIIDKRPYTNSKGETSVCSKCRDCHDLYGQDFNYNVNSCPEGQRLIKNVFYNNSGDSLSCGKCEADNCNCADGYSTTACSSGQVKSYYVRSCDKATCYKCESCPPNKCDPSQGYFVSQAECEKPEIINGQTYTYQCSQKTYTTRCGSNASSLTCWSRTCTDSPTYCKELDKDCKEVATVFVTNHHVCQSGSDTAICGKCCTQIAAPWFQTVGGNLFAQDSINQKVGYDTDSVAKHEWTVDTPADFVNAYLARQAGRFSTTNIKAKTSGIPMVGTGTITNEDALAAGGGFTQRENKSTKASKVSATPQYRQENYQYFTELINYNGLHPCTELKGGEILGGTDGSKVCKTSTSATISDDYQIAAGEKQVVFVEGNLTIDLEDEEKIQVAEGGFLAFIVKGEIVITPQTGEEIITKVEGEENYRKNNNLLVEAGNPNHAGYDQQPQIEGVFIADGRINFQSFGEQTINQKGSNNAFAYNRPCDRKLTVAGVFAGWGTNYDKKGILMKRTFAGCVDQPLEFYDAKGGRLEIEKLSKGDFVNVIVNYPDYNELNPVLTFVYRPDLVLNTPSWLRQTVRFTQEVN